MSQLRSIVERIERVEEEIKSLNDDKRDIYAEAKGNGFNVKALKAVIAYRRKDPTERDELETDVALYLDELSGKSSSGTPNATRARARDPKPAVADPKLTGAAADFVAHGKAGVASLPNTSEIDTSIPAFLDRSVA